MNWYKPLLKQKEKKESRVKNYQRTESYGRSFHSKMEAAHYGNLLLLQRAGELKEVHCQKHIYLSAARITYIVDFWVLTKEEKTIYQEVKGFETPEWKIKKKLWTYYGPGPLEIYKGTYKRLLLTETIIPRTQEEIIDGKERPETE